MQHIAKGWPLLAALVLTACHGAQNLPPPPAVELPTPGLARGVDLAKDASDVAGEIRENGIEFVARYYRDPDSHWPPLSAGEAQTLAARGLKLVAVWEWHSTDPQHYQYYYGYYDAAMADGQARAIGQPAGTPIYFAVDYNAHADALEAIAGYFHGIADGLAAAGGGRPQYKIGVYGSGAVCDAVKGARLAQYSWLTNAIAWHGTADYDDWNIRQGDSLAELSFSHDSDEARDDYGGFQPGGATVAGLPGNAAVASVR